MSLSSFVPHTFSKKHFNSPVFCGHCTKMLWGLGKQGNQCSECQFICHTKCIELLQSDEGCDTTSFDQEMKESKREKRKLTSSDIIFPDDWSTEGDMGGKERQGDHLSAAAIITSSSRARSSVLSNSDSSSSPSNASNDSQSSSSVSSSSHPRRKTLSEKSASTAELIKDLASQKGQVVLELSIACTNLLDMDRLGHSDAFVVISIKYPGEGESKFTFFDRTEVINDNLNPEFAKSLILPYRISHDVLLKMEVFDMDDEENPEDLDKQDFIGMAIFSLSELVAGGLKKEKELKVIKENGEVLKERGFIKIIGEQVNVEENDSEVVNLKIKVNAKGLPKKKLLTEITPMLVMSRFNPETKHKKPVVRTDLLGRTSNPAFNPFWVNENALCNGDRDRPLVIDMFDIRSNATADHIGFCKTTLNEMLDAPVTFPLIDQTKTHKNDYTNSGHVTIEWIDERGDFSILDFLSGGCEINLMVAVDFSGSLHETGDGTYEKAIREVAQVLEVYDDDGVFPMFGFGGNVKGQEYQSVFPMGDENMEYPECKGVQGLTDAYKRISEIATPADKCELAPVIKMANEWAVAKQNRPDEQQYVILMVLTEGDCTDLQDTIDALVQASTAPLSVILVGLGEESKFDKLITLDADDTVLTSSTGLEMARDIVQFVPFSRHEKESFKVLCADVLEEFPDQFLSYMKSRNLVPKVFKV